MLQSDYLMSKRVRLLGFGIKKNQKILVVAVVLMEALTGFDLHKFIFYKLFLI